MESTAERAGPSSIIEDEVSAANAAKLRQQQRAETIRCCGLSCKNTPRLASFCPELLEVVV